MKIPERKNVKEKYKWNLNDLVDGDEAWEKKYGEIASTISSFADYKGKLGDDEVLLEYLKKCDETMVELLKVYCYAYMKTHEDMRVKKYQEMFARVGEQRGLCSAPSPLLPNPKYAKGRRKNLSLFPKSPNFPITVIVSSVLRRTKNTCCPKRKKESLRRRATLPIISTTRFRCSTAPT